MLFRSHFLLLSLFGIFPIFTASINFSGAVLPEPAPSIPFSSFTYIFPKRPNLYGFQDFVSIAIQMCKLHKQAFIQPGRNKSSGDQSLPALYVLCSSNAPLCMAIVIFTNIFYCLSSICPFIILYFYTVMGKCTDDIL